jgi:dihydrofolate reductase
MKTEIQALVAMSPTGIIGLQGKIPWYIKSDLQRFRTNTLHAPIIMGRKTYESIKKPLPSRTNIVLSRNLTFKSEEVSVYYDFNAALDFARTLASKVSIIGGAEIYRQAWPVVDSLLLTVVPYSGSGDTICELPDNPWHLGSIQYFKREDGDTHSHCFMILTKDGLGAARTVQDWIRLSE